MIPHVVPQVPAVRARVTAVLPYVLAVLAQLPVLLPRFLAVAPVFFHRLPQVPTVLPDLAPVFTAVPAILPQLLPVVPDFPAVTLQLTRTRRRSRQGDRRREHDQRPRRQPNGRSHDLTSLLSKGALAAHPLDDRAQARSRWGSFAQRRCPATPARF